MNTTDSIALPRELGGPSLAGLDALDQAERQGWYLRSGRRVAVLAEWRRRCRQMGRPCIVAIRMTREAVIEVDGREVNRVPLEELELAASSAAER